MKTLSILLVVLVVLGAPAIALAAEAGGAAGDHAEITKKDGQAFLGMMLIPAAVLLLALPAAIVFRAGVRLPGRIADTLTDRPVVSVVLGVVNVLLLVLLATAGEAVPAIGVVAGILWLVMMVVALVGLCGAATRLGRRMSGDGVNGDGLGRFTLGWLTISGVSLLPILGFVYFLWLLSGAIGGTLLTLYAGRPVTASAGPSTSDD